MGLFGLVWLQYDLQVRPNKAHCTPLVHNILFQYLLKKCFTVEVNHWKILKANVIFIAEKVESNVPESLAEPLHKSSPNSTMQSENEQDELHTLTGT